METRAWRECSFAFPEHVPTMISPEERQYLYWLGARVWSGRGFVVEIGPWLGGSTVCLAAGMRASGRDARGRLAVFDSFLWRAFMAERAALPLAPGDSFERFFLENTRAFRDIVTSEARALPDEAIEGDADAAGKRFAPDERVPLFEWSSARPVEILFVDGAKSWRGMRHLLRTLAGSFLEGGSLLVCQDYKYWGAYWVPVMMARLEEYVRPVHDVLSATTVSFAVERPIPPEVVERLEDHVSHLPTSETLAALARVAEGLADAGDVAGAHAVALGRVPFLTHQGRVQEAVEAFRACERAWPGAVPALQLERARAYLRNERHARLPRSVRLQLSTWRRQHGQRLGRWLAQRRLQRASFEP